MAERQMNTPQYPPEAVHSAPAVAELQGRRDSPVRPLVFALMCMLALLGYLAYVQYRQAEADAAAITRNLVEVIEPHISDDFSRIDGTLIYIANRVTKDDLQPTSSAAARAAQAQRLAGLKSSFPVVEGLYIFDAGGTLRHASEPNAKQINIADRVHFQKLRDDPKEQVVFSDAQIARTSGKWSIVQLRALRDDQGRFLGTVNAVISMDYISDLFADLDVGPGGVTLLRRSDSFRLIQRMPRNNEKDFNQPLPENNLIRRRIEGGDRFATLTLQASTDGVERLATYKLLDNAPFYVQVAVAKDHYLAGWKRSASGVGAIAVLLLLGFSFIIRQLQKSAKTALAAARQLAYREALFGSLFEQSGFLAGILDRSGCLLEVNQTALDVLGLPREAVIGRHFAEAPWWSRTADRAALEAVLLAAVDGNPGSFEAVHPRAGGGEMTVQFHAVPVQAGNACFIAVTGIDITERKRIELSLAESETNFRTFYNCIQDFLFVLDAQGNILYANDYVVSRLHYTADEVNGKSVLMVHPLARREEAMHIVSEMLAGQAKHCPVPLQTKDGELIPVETRVVSGHWNGQPALFGLSRDMTERVHAEEALRQKTDALALSNAELEQFAYVASHDLRQPLRMVNSYVQLLERRLADKLDPETREMMHFATDGARRMDQMLVSLLDYSRVGRKGEPLVPMASRAGVDEALRFLAPAIAESSATVRVAGDWPQVVASRDEFTRLWQNLIGNALKYRAVDRAPEIDITVTRQHAGGRDGWRFCVADNGIGIDPAQFDRLFKVFQRLHTREQYEGTGIGLAVARKIVERHGGQLWVESVGDDQGCRFCFTLPNSLSPEATP